MYDIAVIGGGPAGLSAAINARMRNKSCIILMQPIQTSWLKKAEHIANYPGFPDVSGNALLDTLMNHATQMGVEFKQAKVTKILPFGEIFMISAENDFIEASSVILASGAAQPKMIPGEENLLGSGVSYCGTCDGMLYRGKRIAIIAESHDAVHEAMFLSSLASKTYYVKQRKLQHDEIPNVTVVEEKVTRINGERQVASISTESGEIPVDGVFIFRDAISLSAMLEGAEKDGNFIKVDRQMKTNIAGVFAAGDITGKPLQIAKAVGEGNIAAISAAEYLDQLRRII